MHAGARSLRANCSTAALACYERVVGRPIQIDTAAPGELLPNLPPVPGLAEVVTNMVAALNSFDFDIDMHETARTFDVQLTSLEEFILATSEVPA